MNEIKELMGICESKDPTDVDRLHLKTLVKKLKQRNETLQSENKQMADVIDTLKQGNYNESAGAKMIFEEQHSQVRHELETAQAELEQLRRENSVLKVDAEKTKQMQSAFQSNNAAIAEKIAETSHQAQEKDAQVDEMKERLGKVEMENAQLREEVGMYKGRCQNLARDVEMHYNEMHKLNNDTSHHSQQNKILHERVAGLEKDIESMRLARNDAQEEARRISQQNEVIEKELIMYRTKQIKAEGDSHSSNATVARL